MNDDPQIPSPDGSPDEPFSELSEAELDAILAQAGSLADQLSVELGHTETTSAEPDPAPVGEKNEEPVSLDDELSQLDELVSATSHEVGEASIQPETPEAPSAAPVPEQPASTWGPEAEKEFQSMFPGGKLPPPPPLELVQQAMTPPEHLNMPSSLTNPHMQPPAAQPAEPPPIAEEPPEPTEEVAPAEDGEGDEDIPDFMREFMEPEAPPETPSEPPPEPEVASSQPVMEATHVPVQMKPGVVGTGMLHKVVRPDQAVAEDGATEAPAEVAAFSNVDALRARLLGLLQLLKRIPSPVPALSRVAYAVCDKALTLLEKVDKPAARLGDRVRTLIGWIAMATLGTSVVVYVVSLF